MNRRSGYRAVRWVGALAASLTVASATLGGGEAKPGADEVSAARRPPSPYNVPIEHGDNEIQLCQALGKSCPGSSTCWGDCGNGDCSSGVQLPEFYQGEYVGRARQGHVAEYWLRVDDEIEFVFRLTRAESPRAYRLDVGDRIKIESVADKELERELEVQPDGTITLRLIGQIRATRQTVSELREVVEQSYLKYYKDPAITITPIKVNTKLEDLRATVDSRSGFGGQRLRTRISPDGAVALPAIGSVPAQGLSLGELKREIDARYAEVVEGFEVTPLLAQRAPRACFVLGEVAKPGRYPLDGPTTVMQAIAMAGSWSVGANVNQIVVFRRTDDWRLVATTLDLRKALVGKQPCPADEIWVSDADLILVPKSKLLLTDNFIDMVFTRGLYRVLPFSTSLSFTNLSAIQ